MAAPKPWTPEREAELRRLWASGMGCVTIARQMGDITSQSISAKVSRLSLPKHIPDTLWTEARMDTLTAMWLAGRSGDEIARKLKVVSRSAVMGKIKRLGLMRSPEVIAMTARLVAPRPPKTVRAKPGPKPTAKVIVMQQPKPRLVCEPITIMQLTPHTCRYPVEGRGETMLSCGDAVAREGAVYCGLHARVCFAPKMAKKVRAPREARG